MSEFQERRRSLLTDEDREHLAAMLSDAMSRRVQDHGTHHKWIEAQIAKDAARTQLWEDLRRHVLKWGSVSVLSILFYLLWLGIRQYTRVT